MPFTRKLNMLLILAGLLAWYGCTFPSFDSGDEAARAKLFSGQTIQTRPYSYGDSAGLTPDFPFNPG